MTPDPRCCPSQDTAAVDVADDATQTPSVSARKVRTMIVQPDGTLVARDEPAPDSNPARCQRARHPGAEDRPAQAGQPPARAAAISRQVGKQVASADSRSARRRN